MPRLRRAALTLLLACGPPPQPTPATGEPSPTAPPPRDPSPVIPAPDAPPPLAPAPEPDPVEPAPDAPEVAQAAPPIATADLTFQIAAYRDGYLDLHRLGDAVFVNGSGGLAHLDRRGRLVHVEYGLSGQAEPWLGLDGWIVHAFGGTWPGNAWLVTRYYQSRGVSQPHVHRRDGAAWKELANKDGALYWTYEHVLNWHSGQVLGLRGWVADPSFGDGEDLSDIPSRDRKKIKDQLARVSRGFDVLGDTRTPTTMVLDPKLRHVHQLAAAPTGELFALGREDSDDGPQHLQRWGLTGAAAVAGTTTQLARKLDCRALAVRSADEAYVGCSRDTRDSSASHLLRFDGAAWTDAADPPPGNAIRRLSVAPSGELWAIVARFSADRGQGELWRRPHAGAAWEHVGLPELRFPDLARTTWTYAIGPEQFKTVPADPAAAERTWTLTPTAILAVTSADVWLVARTTYQRPEIGVDETFREVVLRTHHTGEPLAMLHDEDLYLEALDWRPAPAWKPGDGCSEGIPAFTVLRTLPANAPRDQPEPALEAFLLNNEGLRPHIRDIFEVHRRGRRAIGIYADLPDQTTADALLAALERAAPGEHRTLECRRPRPRRKFDTRTGHAALP